MPEHVAAKPQHEAEGLRSEHNRFVSCCRVQPTWLSGAGHGERPEVDLKGKEHSSRSCPFRSSAPLLNFAQADVVNHKSRRSV